MAATHRPSHHTLKSAPTPNAGQIAYDKQLLADANTSYNYINGKPGKPVGIAPNSAVYTMRSGYDKDSLKGLNDALTDLGIPDDARRLSYYATALRENASGDPTLDNPTSPHSRGLMQVSDRPADNTALHLLDHYAKQGPHIVGTHPPKFAPGLLEVLAASNEKPIQTGNAKDAEAIFKGYGDRYRAMGWNNHNAPVMSSVAKDDKSFTPNIYQAAIDYMNGKRTDANKKAVSLLLHDAKFNAILGITNQRELLAKYSTPKYAVKGIKPAVLADIAYIDPKVADKISAAAQKGRYGDNVAMLLQSKEFGPAMTSKQVKLLMARNGTALDGTVGDVLKWHIDKTTSLLPMREAARQRAVIDLLIMPPQQLQAAAPASAATGIAVAPQPKGNTPAPESLLPPEPTTTRAGLRAAQAGLGPEAAAILDGHNVHRTKGFLGLGLIGRKTDYDGRTLRGAEKRETLLALKERQALDAGKTAKAAKIESQIKRVEAKTGVTPSPNKVGFDIPL